MPSASKTALTRPVGCHPSGHALLTALGLMGLIVGMNGYAATAATAAMTEPPAGAPIAASRPTSHPRLSPPEPP